MDIRPIYISKFNKTREHHANLLMITDGTDTWHYIAIKKIPALLRGASSTVFNHVKLLEYHFHKISISRGSSDVLTLEWIANKKCTINPKNTKDNRCYLYAIVIVLNFHKIPNHP